MSDDLYDVEAEDDFEPVPPDRTESGDQAGRSGRGRAENFQTEKLLLRVLDLIEAARPLPLSASAKINNKEEVVDLLQKALDGLPEELRNARWLIKQRDDYLAKVHVDAERVIETARARAEQMVQRTEVVKAAEQRARRILEGADNEARRMRLECEDYCDQRLAQFEIVLEKTLDDVSKGRKRLQAGLDAVPGLDGLADHAFFADDGE